VSARNRYVALLLRLLPDDFRARHGEEIEGSFRSLRSELGAAPSLFVLLRLYAGMTVDVLRQLPRTVGGREQLCADVRFALRHFRRTWGTTATMLGILTMGMSVAIFLFSFVNSYATQPPPGIPREPDLVRIRGSLVYGDEPSVRTFPQQEFDAYLGLEGGPFTAVAGWIQGPVGIDVPGQSREVAPTGIASFVSDRYFEVLGVSPLLGPGLGRGASSDEGVVIGHVVWTDLFGRDPGVVGRTVVINGIQRTIVGVAPEKFGGIGSITRFKVWLPLSARSAMLPLESEAAPAFRAIARLQPGVSLEAASAAVHAVSMAVQSETPSAPAEAVAPGTPPARMDADVVPLLSANGDPSFDRDVRWLAIGIGTLGLLVVVITSTNVSALLMSLAMARRHEIVVRLSLGAARARVLRQLLTESALLAGVAGGLGLGVMAMLPRLARPLDAWLPFELGVSWPAAIFTLAAALGVTLLFGLIPALHATRSAAAAALRDSAASPSGSRLRAQRGLVVAQVAFTQPLLVALVTVTLLLIQQIRPLQQTAVGAKVVRMQLAADADIVKLRAALEATPGVASTVTAPAPIEIGAYSPADAISGVAGASDDGGAKVVQLAGSTAAPGLFQVMEIPIVRGRAFSDEDLSSAFADGTSASMSAHTGTVPAIIASDLAEHLWPGGEPIGKKLVTAGEKAIDVRPSELVVVGVYDAGSRPPRGGNWYSIYLPGSATSGSALFVRTHGDAGPLLSTIRTVTQRESPGSAAQISTLAAAEEVTLKAFYGVTAGLLGAGGIALLLSAIGLYAVSAFAVGQRRLEVAVRMAVGAAAERVAGGFLWSGVRLGLVGLACGLPLSLAVLRYLAPFFNDQLEVQIPIVQVALLVGALVVLTAAVAAFLPARRAAAVDPARTLRGA
jgi:predicted permease